MMFVVFTESQWATEKDNPVSEDFWIPSVNNDQAFEGN